jgi:hypothetical protein
LETPRRTLALLFGTLGSCGAIAFFIAGWSWFFVPEWTDPVLAQKIVSNISCNSIYDDTLRDQCTSNWYAQIDPLRTKKWGIFDPALGTGITFLCTVIILFVRWLMSPAQDIRAATKWLSVLLSLVATILAGIGVAASIAQEQSREITPMWADTPGGAVFFGVIFGMIVSFLAMMPFMLITIFRGTPSNRIFTPFCGRIRCQVLRLFTFLPTVALVSLLLFGGVMYGNVYFCISAIFMSFGLLDAQSHWANHTHRKMQRTSGDLAQS